MFSSNIGSPVSMRYGSSGRRVDRHAYTVLLDCSALESELITTASSTVFIAVFEEESWGWGDWGWGDWGWGGRLYEDGNPHASHREFFRKMRNP